MLLTWKNRVRETTTTTGTGTLTLGGSPSGGYFPFSVLGNSVSCAYYIDDGAGNVELGQGTYNAGTLSRLTVETSTNSNNLVNFGAGIKTVRLEVPASFFTLPMAGIFNTTDPTVSSDPTNQYLSNLTVTQTGINNSPIFGDCVISEKDQICWSGWNWPGTSNNALAKLTFIMDSYTQDAYGSGQHEMITATQNGYGMGDYLLSVLQQQYAGGIYASGDEGQGISSWQCQQQPFIVQTHINSVVQSSINTTLTQAVVASYLPQTVTVADSTGISTNQYILLGATNIGSATFGDMESVRVTSFTPTSVTGIFQRNHPSGGAVTGATVLRLNNNLYWGQNRICVNRSATPYTTGTASGGSGLVVTGIGTTWLSAGLAGATATNRGAISLAADNQTAAPFNGSQGPLTAWYMIASVSSDTSLNFYHRDAAGLKGYTGNQTTQGNYQIAPAAIILNRSTANNNDIVLSANSFTWTVGDLIECAVSVEADVTAFNLRAYAYLPGAQYRAVIDIANNGLVPFTTAIQVHSNFEPARPYAYGTAISVSDCLVGVNINAIDTLGNQALSLTRNKGAQIIWGGFGNPGVYWNNTSGFLEYFAGPNNNVIGNVVQGKFKASAILTNTVLWDLGGALSIQGPPSGTDEVYMKLICNGGDYLTIQPDGANHRVKFLFTYASNGNQVEGFRIRTGGGVNAFFGVLGSNGSQVVNVTGSRGGNAALASLITAMAAFGFITDGTTA